MAGQSSTQNKVDSGKRAPLKFQQLAADLQRGIRDGTWPAGSKLPTDEALAQETGYSLTTVRRAYDELSVMGLVSRKQGAGTFVDPEHRSEVKATVGVLVPDTALYFPRVLQGIEHSLRAAGARMTLSCSHYDTATETASIRRMLDDKVDGMLLVPNLLGLPKPQARTDELNALPVPVVLVERRPHGAGPADASSYVCTDHEGGAYDAVRHLHSLGHATVALMIREDAPTAAPIERGWRAALTDLGHNSGPLIRLRRDQWDVERARLAIAEIRSAGATAVLCFGDREALLTLSAAESLGLRVPGDLAIVSYDNEFADVASVPLTAVSPPKYQLGKLAAELLMENLRVGDAFSAHQILLRPALVIRASCGARTRGRLPIAGSQQPDRSEE